MFFGGGVKLLFQGKPLKISRVLLELINWVIPGKQTNYILDIDRVRTGFCFDDWVHSHQLKARSTVDYGWLSKSTRGSTWLYYTLPWLYLILLHPTMALLGSTWHYYTSTMALFGSTWLYYTLPHSTWIIFALTLTLFDTDTAVYSSPSCLFSWLSLKYMSVWRFNHI